MFRTILYIILIVTIFFLLLSVEKCIESYESTIPDSYESDISHIKRKVQTIDVTDKGAIEETRAGYVKEAQMQNQIYANNKAITDLEDKLRYIQQKKEREQKEIDADFIIDKTTSFPGYMGSSLSYGSHVISDIKPKPWKKPIKKEESESLTTKMMNKLKSLIFNSKKQCCTQTLDENCTQCGREWVDWKKEQKKKVKKYNKEAKKSEKKAIESLKAAEEAEEEIAMAMKDLDPESPNYHTQLQLLTRKAEKAKQVAMRARTLAEIHKQNALEAEQVAEYEIIKQSKSGWDNLWTTKKKHIINKPDQATAGKCGNYLQQCKTDDDLFVELKKKKHRYESLEGVLKIIRNTLKGDEGNVMHKKPLSESKKRSLLRQEKKYTNLLNAAKNHSNKIKCPGIKNKVDMTNFIGENSFVDYIATSDPDGLSRMVLSDTTCYDDEVGLAKHIFAKRNKVKTCAEAKEAKLCTTAPGIADKYCPVTCDVECKKAVPLEGSGPAYKYHLKSFKTNCIKGTDYSCCVKEKAVSDRKDYAGTVLKLASQCNGMNSNIFAPGKGSPCDSASPCVVEGVETDNCWNTIVDWCKNVDPITTHTRAPYASNLGCNALFYYNEPWKDLKDVDFKKPKPMINASGDPDFEERIKSDEGHSKIMKKKMKDIYEKNKWDETIAKFEDDLKDKERKIESYKKKYEEEGSGMGENKREILIKNWIEAREEKREILNKLEIAKRQKQVDIELLL